MVAIQRRCWRRSEEEGKEREGDTDVICWRRFRKSLRSLAGNGEKCISIDFSFVKRHLKVKSRYDMRTEKERKSDFPRPLDE